MRDWNERYKQGLQVNDQPDPVVVKFASDLKPGRALDIACGPGRHAIWLAERGWKVTAVDSSSVAIEILQECSAREHLPIDTRLADLESHEYVITPAAFDLIVDCNYLQRDLFPEIRTGVCIGGVVIALIAVIDKDPDVKPMNPAYLLDPGQLRSEFRDWELIHDFEGRSGREGRRTRAEIVARRTDTSFAS